MEINLNPYQYDFIYSPKRYPGLFSSWATGKTLCGITRSLIYTKAIPNNLGVIFRKEYTDLRDSTIKDFELYTGKKINSQREVAYPNGSTIMFRHLEEVNNIQNINLGWFLIEQCDELESDKEFFFLFGRLRRKLDPTEEFKQLGLPLRSGFVIGNAGNNWTKPLWKDGKLEDAECIQATTWDNAHNLPTDFMDGLKILEKTKPEVYKQYVLNDWSLTDENFVLIKPHTVEALKGIVHHYSKLQKIVSNDPSTGGDECVLYALENYEIVEEKIMRENDTMKIAGELIVMGNRNKTNNYAIDTIGIGKGIGDRVSEMIKPQDGLVYYVSSAESASEPERFFNKRAEMWWYTMQKILDKEIPYPEDEQLRKELCAVRYEVMNSKGKIKLEDKQKTKQRLGKSPDRGDAYVYGVYNTQFVREIPIMRKDLERYKVNAILKEELSIVNY